MYQRSKKGTNQINDVFMFCHITFDCSFIMSRSFFFTLARSFLSPERAAFIESDLQAAISLFQAVICSLLVSSLLVREVARDKATDKRKRNIVE